METINEITADYIDVYEDFLRTNPRTAIRRVMWLMIYDDQSAEDIRDYLERVKAIPKPEDVKTRNSQMRQVHRWRAKAEESTGLPARGKKGATLEFHRALGEWKKLNGRPTKEQLMAGWTPQPLPTATEATVSPAPAKPVTLPNPPGNPTSVKKPVAQPAPEKAVTESPEVTEAGRKKRNTVPMPPNYNPEDFKPNPPPPLNVVINRGSSVQTD